MPFTGEGQLCPSSTMLDAKCVELNPVELALECSGGQNLCYFFAPMTVGWNILEFHNP